MAETSRLHFLFCFTRPSSQKRSDTHRPDNHQVNSYCGRIRRCHGLFSRFSFQLDAAGPKRACQSLHPVATAVAAQCSGQSPSGELLLQRHCAFICLESLGWQPTLLVGVPVLLTRIITLVEPPQPRIQGLAIISFFFSRLRFLSDVLAYPNATRAFFADQGHTSRFFKAAADQSTAEPPFVAFTLF